MARFTLLLQYVVSLVNDNGFGLLAFKRKADYSKLVALPLHLWNPSDAIRRLFLTLNQGSQLADCGHYTVYIL